MRRICETQIAFFEPRTRARPSWTAPAAYVFMTMVTNDGYGGSEHRASTALMTARKDLPVLARARGRAIAASWAWSATSTSTPGTSSASSPPPAPYDLSQPDLTRLLWVFEGFTSITTTCCCCASGAITQADYPAPAGKTITGVARTPGRLKQSVAESSFDAWTRYYKQDENSPNALVSYYTRVRWWRWDWTC